jgi:hypothetical protein
MTKKLVSLLGAFVLIGCGEKDKSPNSVQTGKETVTVQEVKEEVDAVSSGPKPLISDADVERFAKDAFDIGSASPPAEYTGWIKAYFDGAGTQLTELAQMKNGNPDGPFMLWYETGEISEMNIFKEGEMVSREGYYPTGEKKVTSSPADAGLLELVGWHKNGQKAATTLMKDGAPLMKDGEPVAMKFWNEEGEELDQEEGMKMMEQLQN